jgi:inner membrane protein
MDPITHGLTGAVLYNLGFRRKAALEALLLASIAPDFDYVTRFWGADILLRYHRGITHGILALFVVPVIIGIVFGRKKDFFYYSFIAFIAYAAHLCMDLTNQYGTRILSPLDWQQYSLDLIFIVDPYVTVGLLLSAVLCKTNRKRAVGIALITIVLFMGYAGGRYYLHNMTRDFLKQRLDEKTYTICPLPNAFLRWWFIAKSDDTIKVGFSDLFLQRICLQETYSTAHKDPLIERSKELRVVKNFLYFAKYPYAYVMKEKDKIIVVWRELAYSFLPGDHFVAKVIYDEKGRVLKSFVRF